MLMLSQMSSICPKIEFHVVCEGRPSVYQADVQPHGIFLFVWMCYLNPFQCCLLLEVMKQFSPACAQWLCIDSSILSKL